MAMRAPTRVLAGVILAAGGLTYLLGGSPAQSAQQAPTPAEESVIAHTTAFQTSATAEDSVPGATMLTGRVRRVGSRSADRRVWAAITPTQDCVQLGENGAEACAAPERLAVEPLIVGASIERGVQPRAPGEPLPEPTERAGLAEDNVEAINVVYSDGATETIPVVDDGFYVNTLGHKIQSISWTTSDGTIHTHKEGS